MYHKKKTTIYVLLIFAFLPLASEISAQSWIKHYPIQGFYDLGSYIGSYAGNAIESYDKGIYIAGVNGISVRSATGIILKTDINGNILWERTIGKNKQQVNIAGIASTSDGGIAVSGSIEVNFGDTSSNDFLFKLDACGELQWCKIYKLVRPSVSGQVAELKNGDFVVGSDITINWNGVNNFYNSWIFRTDNIGNIKWQNYDALRIADMLIDKSENIITTGATALPYPNDLTTLYIKSALNKTAPNGKGLWQKEYSRENHVDCQGISTVQSGDGGYIVFGSKRDLIQVNSALFLLKYDPNGNVPWTKLIGDTTVEEAPYSIMPISDSTFFLLAISGYDDFGNGGVFKLFKINVQGDVLKQTVLPINAHQIIWLNCKATSDGKFFAAGERNYITNNTYSDSLVVMKFNSDLQLDTFYTHDTNKYDYRCGTKPVFSKEIDFTTDTIYITIPFPNFRDSLQPGNFLIYPNPVADGIVHIRSPQGNAPTDFNLYDMLGRQVGDLRFFTGTNGHADVRLPTLASGCYIATLMQNGKRYTQKLIVE